MKTLCVVLFCCWAVEVSCLGLREEFSWTRITYAWPQGRQSRQARYGGTLQADTIAFPGSTNGAAPEGTTSQPPANIDYIYQNNIPMGANIWKDKLFITVPRRRVGVPSTLNYIPLNSTQKTNVPLIPYPSWESNSMDSPNGFVSIYRVAVDSCDRLWFVDTGLIETPGNPNQVRPAALVIMDLNTDQVIQRYEFNTSFLRPATTLASVTLDMTPNRCEDVFAYIPDLGGYGLIVYSLKENRAWRIAHNFFFLEPMAGDFSIGGHNFQWNDGIFSVALSEVKKDGFRDAFFHSMAGTHMYKVSTRVLKSEGLATRSYHGDDFKIVGDRGDLSQSSSSDIHKLTGIMFMGLVNQNALGCWNTHTPLKDISVVQKDDRRMIYPCDVKVSGNNVLVLTNAMPVFLYGTLNYDETNFRVWMQSVDKAVEGTRCAGRRGGSY